MIAIRHETLRIKTLKVFQKYDVSKPKVKTKITFSHFVRKQIYVSVKQLLYIYRVCMYVINKKSKNNFS